VDGLMRALFDKLVLLTAILAFCVVVLGAYVRLSDAGLGCPDWPGCYGHLAVPHADAAQQVFPGKPLVAHKAWKEMVHRYFAGALGMLILCVCIMAWRIRQSISPTLPTLLVGIVAFQAALGMWTVTLLLKPVIVSLHLIGGMMTLALLAWLTASRWLPSVAQTSALKKWALVGLVVIACQIALGGWTSSNYAALACAGFPTCNGAWWPPTDFSHAFHLVRALGENADGSALSSDALTTIHLIHRLGALVTFLYLGWFGSKLLKRPDFVGWGRLLLGVLLVQVGLGVSNVLFALPLPVAVAHNACAALLLVVLVVINSKMIRGEQV
jgi:cytochrome c oxidase assembly protein subunit 15